MTGSSLLASALLSAAPFIAAFLASAGVAFLETWGVLPPAPLALALAESCGVRVTGLCLTDACGTRLTLACLEDC
eukprot:CAMPEP_0113939336 /NCGR_PEP_ID=MMETSP1339-20121228/5671_1 /TAXON_ID=94617 /ORGANISM="Fibrocapsa japonica" /LENGTH=74 /DNA_ID=CAMNT_0000942811 /DNA_START=330 /DNA_END=554 /DNA_ORIENTATION=- /assembly_acc=CAM_ASM_000762